MTIETTQSVELTRLETGATLADSVVDLYTADKPEKTSVRYADITRLEFTGKDRAAGKQWEDWIRKYNERKAAGDIGCLYVGHLVYTDESDYPSAIETGWVQQGVAEFRRFDNRPPSH